MTNFTDKQLNQEGEYIFPYHYLDLNVEQYKFLWNIEYLNYITTIKNLLKPFDGQLVLDAGCGDGRFCYELKDDNLKIVGVDFSRQALRFAKAFNPNVEFFIQDLKNLNLPYKFDDIVLIEALEHFIPKDIPIILKNLSNVLKKEGRLIISVPSINIKLHKKHYQHFSEKSLNDALKGYFKIVDIFGYSKINFHRKIFLSLRIIGYFVYPIRNKIKLIKNFYKFLDNYYKKNLIISESMDGSGLIAVCKKVK